MKNYVQEGETLTLTAPVGGCVSGSAYKIGRFIGIAQGDADAGDPVDLALVGVFDLAKAAEAVAEGDPAYWDTAALALTKTAGATASTLVGAFAAAALIGDATAPVRLSGGTGAIAASVTLDAVGPTIDDATETTAPAGGILGRNVFGSVECVSEVANGAAFTAKVETAPASGVFKSVNVISHPAGIAATFRDSFAFWVPPGCKYKFAKTVAGGATVAFTGDGYNYADL